MLVDKRTCVMLDEAKCKPGNRLEKGVRVLYNFKPVVVAHTCNSSTKEAETGGLQDWS